MTTRLIQGDCREVLAALPEQSVQCVVTSPPYWGLRSYQNAAGTVWGGDSGHEHEWQATNAGSRVAVEGQSNCFCGAWRGVLGSEPTPEQYVANMVTVFRAVHRVLRDDGTLWLNLGPTWAGSGGAGGDYAEGVLREGQPVYRQDTNSAKQKSNPGAVDGPNRALKQANWPAKCMVPIPWMVGLALVKDGWILRSEIIWDKPSPMPESVTDRPTKAHEQILLLVKQGRYYYDAGAIREPALTENKADAQYEGGRRSDDMESYGHSKNGWKGGFAPTAGRNARSVWRIAPEPSPEKHFAMFPSELPRRCILAGTSERGRCPTCGAPWTRQIETTQEFLSNQPGGQHRGDSNRDPATRTDTPTQRTRRIDKTLGWLPSCAHGLEPVPSVVLDPFMGTATTLVVARQLGRSGIGIELSPDYMRIAEKRLEATPTAFAGA